LQKNFMYFHCSTWAVVISNGNIHPLHGHLRHTNASQTFQPAPHTAWFTSCTLQSIYFNWQQGYLAMTNSRNVLIIPGNVGHCIFKSIIPLEVIINFKNLFNKKIIKFIWKMLEIN
jgi:hypothetical protein